jgi:flagella basal body P-ring formation protein FlgA
MAVLLAAVAIVAPGGPVSAAALRSQVSLHGSNVKLSDLFSGLQPGQDCDIGPAPAPGQRIVIPPTQLAAIASQFGVDWQLGSNYKSVTLDRPARLVKREEILAVLTPALAASGVPSDSDILLGAFASPSLPADMKATPEIQTMDYDRQSGRFTAMLLFAAPDADPVTLRVTGRTEQQASVLELAHALPAGAMPSVADLQTIRVHVASLHGVPLTTASDIVGLALRQPTGTGVPLTREMLIRPMLVNRGRPVVLRLETAGLTLKTAGTALEAGAAGDRIHVLNSLSHAILIGQVTNTAEIQVDAGTAPTILRQNGMQGGLPQIASGGPAGGRSWNNLAQEAQSP